MNTRARINFWIDCISLIVMVVLAITGGLLYFVLPPGTGHSHSLFGLGRHDFGTVHFYFAVVGVVLLAVHVYLHWTWICSYIGKSLGSVVPSRRSQTTWGILFLCSVIVLLGGGMWWAAGEVERNILNDDERKHHNHDLLHPGPKIASLKSEERQATPSPQTLSNRLSGDESVYATSNKKPAITREKIVHDKHEEDCPIGATINGRTPLSQAARKCRMSVQQIKKYLNLPTKVASNERLGRLKRWYGLSIHDVRRLACR